VDVTVSHEVMKNTVAEVSYVGNHGLHIWRFINGNYNQVLPQYERQWLQEQEAPTSPAGLALPMA